MEKQSSRRKLVIATYCGLLLLGLVMWPLAGLQNAGTFVFMAAILLVNGYIFGGYGARGLLKPFANKPPRPEPVEHTLVRLELERKTGLDLETQNWQSDERELRRRDSVHYQAYQPMLLVFLLLWLLSGWSLHRPQWMPAAALPILLYGVTLPGAVMAITLPQAILLWTEKDVVALD